MGRRVLHVLLVEPLEIGRDCDGIMISDPKVSRAHALLEPHADGLIVEDLSSRNGTWVNGVRITSRAKVTAQDSLTVGDVAILVVTDHDPSRSRQAATIDPRSSIALVLDSWTRAPSSMPRQAAAVDGTITIMFSDIEGSTDLVHQFGDRRWMELLGRHNEIVRSCIASHGGTEVKTIGDGFMVTFPSAMSGLQCAAGIQASIVDEGDRNHWPIRVRLGLHTGEVLRAGGDVFGAHVNIAARVAAQAHGEEVLVSGLLHDLVRPVSLWPMSAGHDVELKGVPGSTRVHLVEWRAALRGTPKSTDAP